VVLGKLRGSQLEAISDRQAATSDWCGNPDLVREYLIYNMLHSRSYDPTVAVVAAMHATLSFRLSSLRSLSLRPAAQFREEVSRPALRPQAQAQFG
jgi:hypothetical protein